MLLTLLQLFLAYLFLNTGLEKALHPAHAVQATGRLVPRLQVVAGPVGLLVIAAELGAAAALLVRPLVLLGLLASALLLSLFLVVLSLAMGREGPVTDCGCGSHSSPADSAAVGRTVILISLASLGLGLRALSPSVWTETPASAYEVLAIGVMSFVVLPQIYFGMKVKRRRQSPLVKLGNRASGQ